MSPVSSISALVVSKAIEPLARPRIFGQGHESELQLGSQICTSVCNVFLIPHARNEDAAYMFSSRQACKGENRVARSLWLWSSAHGNRVAALVSSKLVRGDVRRIHDRNLRRRELRRMRLMRLGGPNSGRQRRVAQRGHLRTVRHPQTARGLARTSLQSTRRHGHQIISSFLRLQLRPHFGASVRTDLRASGRRRQRSFHVGTQAGRSLI